MAATGDKYYNNGTSKRSAKIVAVTQVDIPMALMLAEYGTVANIKALFYLDYVRRMARKNADGTVTYVFIGLCKIGSANYSHHAAARVSRRRMSRTLDGVTREDYVWYNDGSLNTKGDSKTKTNHGDTVGNMFLSGEFLAAYYVPTTQYGFEWRNGINGTIKTVQFGSTVQKAPLITKAPAINGNGIKAKDTVSFRTFIVNAEGRWEDPAWRFVTIKPRLIDSGFHDTYASYAYNRVQTRNIYVDTEVVGVGTKFWTEITGTDDAEFGYYSFNGYYYKYDLLNGIPQVVSMAGVGEGWPDGDPGNNGDPNPVGFAQFHATGYSAVSQAAADAMVTEPGAFDLMLYEDPSTGLWYTGYTGTPPNVVWDQAFIEDGYYAQADQFGNVTGQMYLVGRDNQYT